MVLLKTPSDYVCFLSSSEIKQKNGFNHCQVVLLPPGNVCLKNSLSNISSLLNQLNCRVRLGNSDKLTLNHFYEAWERLDLLRRCPQLGYQNWIEIEILYNRLNGQIETIVYAAVGGTLMSKTTDNVYSLLDEITTNSYQGLIGM